MEENKREQQSSKTQTDVLEEIPEIPEYHIELVMVQTGKSREVALAALRKTKGDVVYAILVSLITDAHVYPEFGLDLVSIDVCLGRRCLCLSLCLCLGLCQKRRYTETDTETKTDADNQSMK